MKIPIGDCRAGAVIEDGVTLHAGSGIGMGAIVDAHLRGHEVVACPPARPVVDRLR